MHGSTPSWTIVLLGIATFVLQYSASGCLETPLLGQSLSRVPCLDIVLCSSSALQWYSFDRTWQGTVQPSGCHTVYAFLMLSDSLALDARTSCRSFYGQPHCIGRTIRRDTANSAASSVSLQPCWSIWGAHLDCMGLLLRLSSCWQLRQEGKGRAAVP